jgi:hypothetical protein
MAQKTVRFQVGAVITSLGIAPYSPALRSLTGSMCH